MLKYFCGGPTKIYQHEHLTHEYFHTRKFLDLWHINFCRSESLINNSDDHNSVNDSGSLLLCIIF